MSDIVITMSDIVIKNSVFDEYKRQLQECLADDLNVAKGIGLIWQIVKSKDIDDATKVALILDFDQVLGLKLAEAVTSSSPENNEPLPDDIVKLVAERDNARASRDFALSDTLRAEIESLGYEVKDTPEGTKVIKR